MGTVVKRNKKNQITYFEVDLPSWYKIKITTEDDTLSKKLKYFWWLFGTVREDKVLTHSANDSLDFQSCCKDLIISVEAWINTKPRKPGQNPTNGERKLVKNLEKALADVFKN